MSTTHEFYRVRAAEARSAAEAATLDNVRERHLTAAAAWETMAERGERTVRKRAETEAWKAAALAADPLASSHGEPSTEARAPAEEETPE